MRELSGVSAVRNMEMLLQCLEESQNVEDVGSAKGEKKGFVVNGSPIDHFCTENILTCDGRKCTGVYD